MIELFMVENYINTGEILSDFINEEENAYLINNIKLKTNFWVWT